MPGVSRNTTCASGWFFTPRIRFLVVCGLSDTMASLVPTRRLSSVDFPAFGRPMRETNPVFTQNPLHQEGYREHGGSSQSAFYLRAFRLLCGAESRNSHAGDAAARDVAHLDRQAVP